MEARPRTFEIASCLGRGGFGEVYRARMHRDGGLATEVALKVLRRDIHPDGQAVQRLRDEGRLLARLNHPSILKVHDLLVLDGRIALVTEYVDGADLSGCLDGPVPVGPRALLQVIARVGSALSAAWAALRLVHRDIKPSNIRLSRHGDVKLLDFGIARTDAVDREARTRTDMMVGSPAYMAPERFLEKQIRLESDVFSLGAILYEGLAGERLWADLPVPLQVGLAFQSERYTPWLEGRLARVDARPELRALLLDTLAWDPATRPGPEALAERAESLADRLGGPTLSRWASARPWPTPAATAGELDGRSLTESTLLDLASTGAKLHRAPAPTSAVHRPAGIPPQPAPPGAPPAAPPPPDPSTTTSTTWERPARWALVGLGGTGLVGGLLGVGAVALAAVVVGLGLLGPAGQDAPVGEVAPVGQDAPAEPPLAVLGEDPDPLQPGRVERWRGRRPAPSAAPVSPPSGPGLGRIEVSGDVVALVRTPAGDRLLPADLPAGTYTLYARFNGRDAVDAGPITVRAGQTVSTQCSTRMTRCTLR